MTAPGLFSLIMSEGRLVVYSGILFAVRHFAFGSGGARLFVNGEFSHHKGAHHYRLLTLFASKARRVLSSRAKHVALVGLSGVTFASALNEFEIRLQAAAQAAPENAPIEEITGHWVTEGYGAVVSIAACTENSSKLCGTLVWAWNPDEFESDAVGGLIFWGAHFEDEYWRGGRLRNPSDGRVYRGKIAKLGQNRLALDHGA